MPITGTEAIVIKASPERILAVVGAVEEWPSWKPGFTKAAVNARDEQGRPTEIEERFEAYGSQHQIHTVTWGDDWITWERTGGDNRMLVGRWRYQLEPQGDTTRLVHDYLMDLRAPIPDIILRPGVKKAIKAKLEALKARAESA